MFDIQPTLNIRPTLEKRLTPVVTLSVFCNWKKPSCALTPKDSDEQSFFIVNSGKAGSYHPCFINSMAGRGYPRSINKNGGRYHPRTIIEEAMCRW